MNLPVINVFLVTQLFSTHFVVRVEEGIFVKPQFIERRNKKCDDITVFSQTIKMVLFNAAAQNTKKVVNVALVGPGGVGTSVLEQLSKLEQFKLISITNSKGTYLNESGIPFASAKSELGKATPKCLEKEVIPALAKQQPCIFIDNTSSEDVAKLYPVALSHGVHVVTPNKVGYSASLSLYNHIKDASAASGAFAYKESTVGAGLPVISTLETLLKTGDKVTKIEGVLSGTMSYLFNTYSKSGKNDDILFSKLVSDARDQGYTEPHPGSDLSGSDVARKLAIQIGRAHV